MQKRPWGALILHGITGTPENVRGIAPPLESLGLLCRLPTLRGHGAETPEALRGVTWREWMADGENALFDLLKETEKAIVIGHSMGGWIALNLAAKHQERIDSIVVASAATEISSPLAPGGPLHFLVPLLVRLIKKWDLADLSATFEWAQHAPTYAWVPTDALNSLFDFAKETKRRLPEVRVPTLIMQSKNDAVISPQGALTLYNSIPTPRDQKQLIWFERTGHELFLDCERENAIRAVAEYVKERMNTV